MWDSLVTAEAPAGLSNLSQPTPAWLPSEGDEDLNAVAAMTGGSQTGGVS